MTEVHETAELDGGRRPDRDDVLMAVRQVTQQFTVRKRGGLKGGTIQAVSGVSFDIYKGETLGIVGESGSGKSTLAQSILQSPPPKAGEVWFRQEDLVRASRRQLGEARRQMQIVFQDPFTSLDPTWRVRRIIEEPLTGYNVGTKASRSARADELLGLVGLDPVLYGRRRSRELSGGQAQRVAIARALALNPALIICDEAVSSLDVLTQAQILELLGELRQALGLSYLFIAHNLAVVRQVSDRVAVMYLGKLCEIGVTTSLYREPRHPYTRALLEAVPSADPSQGRPNPDRTISGEPASPLNPPSGCRFRTRCPRAQDRCAAEEPMLTQHGPDQWVACHFPLGIGSSEGGDASDPAVLDDPEPIRKGR